MNTVKPFSWGQRGSLLATMRMFAVERKKEEDGWKASWKQLQAVETNTVLKCSWEADGMAVIFP